MFENITEENMETIYAVNEASSKVLTVSGLVNAGLLGYVAWAGKRISTGLAKVTTVATAVSGIATLATGYVISKNADRFLDDELRKLFNDDEDEEAPVSDAEPVDVDNTVTNTEDTNKEEKVLGASRDLAADAANMRADDVTA